MARRAGPTLVLLLAVLAGPALAAEPRFVDALVAEVGGAPVAASDVALARALGLFGLARAAGPLGADEVERYARAQLVVREATRLGLEISAEDLVAAWAAAAAPWGGVAALEAWLGEAGVGRDWAERLLEADLGRRRFVGLRFRALAVVPETEVAATLGAGPHTAEARAAARERLREAAAAERFAAWLDAERRRVPVRLLLEAGRRVPAPLDVPGP